jgi:2'-5' RNA ligase
MPQKPAGPRYSWWFVPTGTVWDRLSPILHELSARFGSPSFPPHVTLLGGCAGPRRDLIRKSAQVAAALRPLVIRLEEIDFLDEYYRCLFVRAALTEPLRKAHQVAHRTLDHGREPSFMPHLSLLYGNFERSIKEGLIAELGPRFDLQFKARSLDLWVTHGDPRDWRQVAKFGLQ